MEIRILNEESAKVYQEDRNHIFISIQDPNKELIELPMNLNRIGTTFLKFSDLDRPLNNGYDQYLFTDIDARLILDMVQVGLGLKIDIVYVNCVVGISRSAGVGAALGKIFNNDDSYFFQKYLPNMFVYRTILDSYYGKAETND